MQGGRHVDYVADQVITKLIEVVKKKNKAGVTVKPFQVFLHLWSWGKNQPFHIIVNYMWIK